MKNGVFKACCQNNCVISYPERPELLKRISFVAASPHLLRRRKRTQGFGYGFLACMLMVAKTAATLPKGLVRYT